MATADDYARWIVENQDKRGTPEFNTVAEAYQLAKADDAPKPPPDSIGRQAGLFARSGVKAAAALPAMLLDGVQGIANASLDAVGDTRVPRFKQPMGQLDALMTRAGLPEPATPMERIVSQGVELGTGAGAGAKLAQKASQVAGPMFSAGLSRMGDNVGVQAIGGASAGAAGQQSKESGDTWAMQLVSSVVGGLLGGGGAAGVKSAVGGLREAITPRVTSEVIEQRITMALREQGIDAASISPSMRSAISEQVKRALKQGPVEGAAIGRLADYTLTGTTPTQGRLSLDPYQITQEMNAAKKAAALGMRDAELPTVQNENNKRLIELIEGYKPVADRFTVGTRATAPILGKDASMGAAADALYKQTREMGGKDIPLERGRVLGEVMRRLEAEDLMPFADSKVMAMINQTMANPDIPFTVGKLESLRRVATGAFSPTANGNEKRALKIITETLDGADVAPDKRAFGSGQLVTPQMADRMTAADSMPGQLKETFDQARKAHADRMRWRESSPGVQRTVEGANPDEFVKREILARTASTADVAKIAQELRASPDAFEAARSGIAQYLKDAAIGRGRDGAVANFSGPGLQSALDNIGKAKLRLFFEADEVDKLMAMARVGATETFQPRGSAVNNSNTAAGIAGMLDSILRIAGPKVNAIPFGQMAITTPLQHLTVGAMTRGTMNQPLGLLSPRAGQAGSMIDPLAVPSIMLGSGLLSPN